MLLTMTSLSNSFSEFFSLRLAVAVAFKLIETYNKINLVQTVGALDNKDTYTFDSSSPEPLVKNLPLG